jgi:peptide/nickel transport system permease protein
MPALTSLLYTIPELISIEVGLSFFGLGVQPPTPTLGKLIYEGLSEFYTGWWLSLFPATVLFFIITLIYYLVSKVESRKILQTGVYSND